MVYAAVADRGAARHLLVEIDDIGARLALADFVPPTELPD